MIVFGVKPLYTLSLGDVHKILSTGSSGLTLDRYVRISYGFSGRIRET